MFLSNTPLLLLMHGPFWFPNDAEWLFYVLRLGMFLHSELCVQNIVLWYLCEHREVPQVWVVEGLVLEERKEKLAARAVRQLDELCVDVPLHIVDDDGIDVDAEVQASSLCAPSLHRPSIQ